MSGRIVALEPDLHQAIQALLPWYLNGTLRADEDERVRLHLAACPDCCAAWAVERRLREAVVMATASEATPASVDRAWHALRPQLVPPRAPPWRSRWARVRAGWRDSAPWLRLLALGQAVAVGVLLAPALDRLRPDASAAHPDSAYRALGDAPWTTASATPNLIVRFRPQATEAQMRDALRGAGARLTGGPTRTDAYLLVVPSTKEAQALAALRAHPAVLLAESMDGGAR